MAIRFRRLRDSSRVLSQIHSGNYSIQSRQCTNSIASYSNPMPRVLSTINRSLPDRVCRAQRFSTITEIPHESFCEDALLSFIGSAFNDLQGPDHCWLNSIELGKDFSSRNGVFLVLVGTFLEDSLISSGNPGFMFEKAKSLQQRYPLLRVIGFQYSSSKCSDVVHTCIAQIAMKEYITFPILLSNKDFSKVTDRACFILFKDFKGPFVYYGSDMDLGIIDKAIKELLQHSENHGMAGNMKSTWVKPIEIIKEPQVCSSLRNLLFYYPGCISVDESGNRLFLSDTNHHRIIIFDGNGKILDCIGSSQGFEDGEFESAKLMRPAASFYHATANCLYFVESENHAVRRADLERRVLETLYPTSSGDKKNNSLWSWIKNMLGMEKDVDVKSGNLDSESFLFPWHLIKSSDNDLFIFNQSFQTLWIMDMASGVIKEAVKGFPRISELCGELILEKTSLLKQIQGNWPKQQGDNNELLDWISYANLLSSLATFRDHIVICDTVGQRVLKFRKESGSISSFHFSNFGILGLPYWISSPLERVYSVGDAMLGVHVDHTECFSLLPGRIDIQLNVDMPKDVELVEPLQEGCVWRQTRGAATEISGAESRVASSEKVGVSQQWYDELDSLAFSTPEVELSTEENASDVNDQDEGVCINCAVQTSPGTSEVIVFASLYLRLKESSDSSDDGKEKKAARMAEILNPKGAERMGRDPIIQLLMKSNRNLEEIIFMKPLHVRLKFDCRDHPKADNSKDIILTDSSIEVNVSLS